MKFNTIVIAVLLTTNLALNFANANDLPELGDVSQTVLSPLQEQAIAEQIMRDVATSDAVVQDAEITSYLQALGMRLVSNSPDSQLKFNFFVVQDNSINAFAMPGGVIGVHTGLILAANSESELASVLGHEIGHVTQHHLARMLAAQKYDTFKNIAGIALALLVARANPQLASGALTTASAVGVQNQLDYTREHEREADRIGLQILNSGGFDVRGMPAFFTTLQRGSRYSEGSAPGFLRTHPLTSERIADVSNRVGQMSYKQVPDSVEFRYVRAKLQANNGVPETNIAVFEQNIRERRYTNEAAEHYGLAVAYMRKNALAPAEKEITWLKKNAPQHAMIENLNARLQVAKNNPQQAAKQYADALKIYPDNRALIYGYADHFLAVKQADSAIKLVKEKQNLYPNDAFLYDVLAKAYTMQNKVLLSHQAQGEAYFRKYDLARAIEQMELAAKAKDGDFYQISIVEARLKELRRMQGDVKKG
ncbi:M48 family metalloprotease [Methylotenera sp.]|uniref:M48 family metalloprotease n=1 Tax=Methylotenera sp. TaxID=2051956 RepID=UPI002722C15E|nr:M48 family metalloprotease [Methylotenera sp.]MDO9205087.1 M48 family metalloprotease [Methylotenera sp.]MDP2231909.1 M48 family metalloprotease [Methylotenera sp.]MDP3141008.1 M48 family metalloprotease [Methylotenera sp.]MDP3308884.1 M48 family metalloprotease [Methylotenera sp.]